MVVDRFSHRPFRETLAALMADHGRHGMSFRELGLRAELSAGYLNHLVHGKRPCPDDAVLARLAGAFDRDPDVFIEYRVRLVADHLAAHPADLDRAYHQALADVHRAFRPTVRVS